MEQVNDKHPRKQPEEGSDKELNLTNNDASLSKQGNLQQLDAPTMNDSAANVNNENLTQSAREDGEVNPEHGDAAEHTFETL